MNFDRWVLADGLLLGEEALPVVRNDEYDCAFPTDAERPFVPGTLASLAAFREAARRGSAAG